MSIEAATAFKQLATEDAALQAEVLAQYEVGGLPAVCDLAAGKGYVFTAADAEAALSAAAPAEGELSDMELAGVAGGKGVTSALKDIGRDFKGIGKGIGQGVKNIGKNFG